MHDATTVLFEFIFAMPVRKFVPAWQEGLVAKHAIPEAGMVSTNILGTVQASQPTQDEFIREAILPCPFPFDHGLQTFKESQEISNGHPLCCHPTRDVSVYCKIIIGLLYNCGCMS